MAIAGEVVTAGLPGAVSPQSSDSVSVAASGHFRTMAALNFRSTASLSSPVTLVIAKGGLVAAAGPGQNRFIKGSFVGDIGGAHRDFPTVSNGGSSDTPVYAGNGYTTNVIHMPTGPRANFSVTRMLQAGTTIELFGGLLE